MADAIILIDDQSDDIIFSGPSWPVLLNNMQDPRMSKVCRSSDAQTVNTQFFMSYPEPITIEDFIMCGTNIDKDAMGRLTAYSDALFEDLIYTTGLIPLWTSTQDIQDTDNRGVPIIMDLGGPWTSAYFQMEIVNPYNADGFFQAAKLFMGRRLNIDYNFAFGSTFSRDPKTLIDEALAGARYYNRHKSMRSWSLSFTGQTYEAGWDEFDKAFELCGLDRPVFVIPYPDDLERKQRQSFLGTFNKISDLQMIEANLVSTSLMITENIG